MSLIDLRCARPAASADTLRTALTELLARLHARDGGLTAARLQGVILRDDATEADQAAALSREDAADGFTITLSAPFVERSLSGAPEHMLQLVHALHRELWRGELAAEPATEQARDALTAQFSPIADLMLAEYRANRASAWSLPSDADLLLPHLLRLLDEFPAASARAQSDYLQDGDLDTLVGLCMARLTHLMQTVAFCLGYLAGLQRSAADIAPELKAGIDSSLIGREWPRIAALLAGAAASDGDGRALQMDLLATRITSVLAAMGLVARLGHDGAVRMDVVPPHATARPDDAPLH
jgi:hypothetical protein